MKTRFAIAPVGESGASKRIEEHRKTEVGVEPRSHEPAPFEADGGSNQKRPPVFA
jgi:hypothetical protein